MPVRMVALRKHYVSEARKEYNAGETYVVHDKRIAEKLERRMKAKPQPETAADRRFPPAAAPQKVRGRALTAEPETPPWPAPIPATLVEVPAPGLDTPALTTAAEPDTGEASPGRGRYARRDMRSEEA